MLAIAMMLSLCACLEDAEDIDNDTKESVESDEKEDDKNNDEDETETESNEETDNKAENDIVFEEIVIVDNGDCVIKAIDLEYSIIMGTSLKIYLENKSSDKTYMYSVDSASINGVEIEPFFASEVAAGKKSNENIYLSEFLMEDSGITEYTDIELTFRVYDSEDWLADDVVNTTVHIYPYGEDKAERFERAPQDTDNIIIDNEYITVIVTGYENDDIWGFTANLFLVNKTDKNIMFTAEDVAVNGFMSDPFYAETVHAGKVAFSSISWLDSTLEKNDITDIEEIEMTFRAYDEDDWFGDDLANETVTLNP